MPIRRGRSAVGVDVGGTFTDIVVSSEAGFAVLKVPTSNEPEEAVLGGLRRLGRRARDVEMITHATTLATNALLTGAVGAKTALITNEGFRDVLEIGRQRRPELYDLDTRRPSPLVKSRDRLTVSCRIASDGSVVLPLVQKSLGVLTKSVTNARFDAVAICFLNSHLNGGHERIVRSALIRGGFRGHISISSEVDPEYREYERTSTTVVNAVLSPLLTRYLSSLEGSLRRSGIVAPVYVMSSDGGSSTISFASSRPVTVIESGPAAGVVASQRLARELSFERVLTFDMGGTTAKAGTVIDGESDITTEFEAAGRTHSGRSIRGSGYPVRGQFIDLAEVSAGGGTVAWVDEGGDLRVGPRSTGSTPGPACYDKGGTEPTVTDANVLLGRLNPESLLGGAMPIRKELARRSMKGLARRLDLDESGVAVGILRLVNNSMGRALSMVTVERGRDPRGFTMFAFGGAGPVHACDLAEEMGVDEVFVPVHAGLFSAYGLLIGDFTRTFAASVMETNAALKVKFSALESAAKRQLSAEGFTRYSIRRYFEGRYKGQSHELLLPFISDERARLEFDARHRELYGYSLKENLEVVTIRVRASVRANLPSAPPLAGSDGKQRPSSRRAWIAGQSLSVRVIPRDSLSPGSRGRGPCIIEEYDSTLVVNPSWEWEVEPRGTRLSR